MLEILEFPWFFRTAGAQKKNNTSLIFHHAACRGGRALTLLSLFDEKSPWKNCYFPWQSVKNYRYFLDQFLERFLLPSKRFQKWMLLLLYTIP